MDSGAGEARDGRVPRRRGARPGRPPIARDPTTARAPRTFPAPYPYWFYLPAGVIYGSSSSSRRSSRSTSRSPAGRCSTRTSSAWTTSGSSSRSRRCGSGLTQHADLRGDHQRAQGRARHGARGPADRPRSSAAGSCARWSSSRSWSARSASASPSGADATRHRRDQPVPRRRRHPGPGWLGRPAPGAVLGGAGRRLEGRRPRHGHLHRRHPVHPAGVLRGGAGRRRRRAGSSSGTSRCRWPGRPPSRSSSCRSSAACARST